MKIVTILFVLCSLTGIVFGEIKDDDQLHISLSTSGEYNISIGNRQWLQSSRTAFYANNYWYSTENNTLTLIRTSMLSGQDEFGNWQDMIYLWKLSSVNITTRIRTYLNQQFILFYQDFNQELSSGTMQLGMDLVRTVFPSFMIQSNDIKRGYISYGGMMFGDTEKHAGKWDTTTAFIKDGISGGPLVIFDQQNHVLVLSSFSEFMSTSLSHRGMAGGSIEFGVMGSIDPIPSNYTNSFIIYYGNNGINDAVHNWGLTLRKYYNKTDDDRLNDVTINYLGYYTDNGAYYYYHTELNLNYQQTILALSKHIHEIGLPVRYFQYDSWFYYKGIGDGVSEWESRPDIFPDGMAQLNNKVQLPIGAHNRYWASNTTYAKDNGGKYDFLIDKINQKSLPVGNDSFWTDLFYTARTKWGLVMYEQDWMNHQTIDFNYLRVDARLGRQWLMSMGKAADEQNLNIQYCMSLSRHALQSVEIPRVTQARVSDDYYVHLVDHRPQWKIGITSMFAHALGIAPYKDVFWSTSEQPQNPYKNASEPNPDLQILISTLSMGPVTPGDRIGYFDVDRIMKCCNEDGLILKPNRPLTMIDKLLQDWSMNDGTSQGELYSTYSTVGPDDSPYRFYILFASNMKSNYDIYPQDLGISVPYLSLSYVAWSWNNPFELIKFNSNNSLSITKNACGTNDQNSFCLWYISPVFQFSQPSVSSYSLLGELNKWVPVSKQRFESLEVPKSNDRITFNVRGSSLEYTQFLVYSESLGGVIILPCQLSSDGNGQIVITTQSAICLPS